MTQWAKVLATEDDGLSLFLETQVVEEKQFPQLVL